MGLLRRSRIEMARGVFCSWCGLAFDWAERCPYCDYPRQEPVRFYPRVADNLKQTDTKEPQP